MTRNIDIDTDTLAIQAGVRDALREHALMGRSVSIWRDGQIVELLPPEILEELKKQEQSNGDLNGAD